MRDGAQMLTADAAAEVRRVAVTVQQFYENLLPDAANALAIKFSIPRREADRLERPVPGREGRASAFYAAEAAETPELVEEN